MKMVETLRSTKSFEQSFPARIGIAFEPKHIFRRCMVMACTQLNGIGYHTFTLLGGNQYYFPAISLLSVGDVEACGLGFLSIYGVRACQRRPLDMKIKALRNSSGA